MKRIGQILGILMTVAAVGFNLWLYRLEPTSKVDPNDNAFQYGLVARTDAIWNFADRTCTGIGKPLCVAGFLVDHWVPNWAQGFNLPYYYSHVPQIAIVGSYRVLSPVIHAVDPSVDLYRFYHLVIYLLLCVMPLPVFFALRVIGLPWLVAGLGAGIASHISTDGLYGIDQASFLWRGWGLSSQLFASVWFPLAVAYPMAFLRRGIEITGIRDILSLPRNPRLGSRDYWLSVLFLVLTTSGHLGMGMTAFITVGVVAVSPLLVALINRRPLRELKRLVVGAVANTAVLALPPLLLLSYWIVPAMVNNTYHNTSFWDPVWKFDSYGVKEVFVNLGNGALFDFDRLPVFTLLVLVGAFVALMTAVRKPAPKPDDETAIPLYPLAFLFVFWLCMYFGRTTWGGILDLIPGMSEYHQHRFIVMVQLMGLFLAPLGAAWIAGGANAFLWRIAACLAGVGGVRSPAGAVAVWRQAGQRAVRYASRSHGIALVLTGAALVALLYPATLRYAKWNDVLIRQADGYYAKAAPDAAELVRTLQALPPGRVFAGRGGWWGKSFRIAETPYYMYLSTLGFPTIAWLPETWSMNSDTEQFFGEDNQSHYGLYDLKYVVAPPTQPAQPFWKKIKTNPSWTLYETDADGYITGGTSPSVISVNKGNLVNLVHLWVQSDYPKSLLFPQLTYGKPDDDDRRPRFTMVDEANYRVQDGTRYSLMRNKPVYISAKPAVTVKNQKTDADMVFSADVTVPSPCHSCVAVLKQTYHPQWQATVDGVPAKTFAVFPFFTAVSLPEGGTHTVVFRYGPGQEKLILLLVAGIAVVGGTGIAVWRRVFPH
jgi:hypothetical protein